MLGYYDLVVMQAVLCVFVVYDLLDQGSLLMGIAGIGIIGQLAGTYPTIASGLGWWTFINIVIGLLLGPLFAGGILAIVYLVNMVGRRILARRAAYKLSGEDIKTYGEAQHSFSAFCLNGYPDHIDGWGLV